MIKQYSLEEQTEMLKLNRIWPEVVAALNEDVSSTVLDRFIRTLKPHSYEKGIVTLLAPGAFVQEWVQGKYAPKIKELLHLFLEEEVKLHIAIDGKKDDSGKKEQSQNVITALSESNTGKSMDATYQVSQPAPSAPSAPSTPSNQHSISQSASSSIQVPGRFKPNEKYRFDTFIVGQSNRLAYAGAKSVATDPGKKYNPLFIYGPSGLGKTHLLHSIAQEIHLRYPKLTINYVSAQQFAEEFVHALQNNKIDQFRRAQRNIGIWLVDDIQFVAGKDKTQEEIFHTFNYMHSLGKQVVLCSDRPPRELFLMDERLRSRFEAGLVADIQPPDTETRCAILLSKAKQEALELEPAIAMFLAERVPGNIRILEGALIKLAAQASLENSKISIELAKQVIDSYYQSSSKGRPSTQQITELVSKHYNISIDLIRGSSRKAPIAHARHVAIYITRQITGDSWKHIGSYFSNRDHTSIMHAYQKISDMIVHDQSLRNDINQIIRDFQLEV